VFFDEDVPRKLAPRQMRVAMLRIGVDSGSGGIHGPLFHDGSFDYVPIPDRRGIDERTYGNTTGLKQRKLVEYFPEPRRVAMADRSIHFDPEFVTFTYGDATRPKAGLGDLDKGDMLIFYCGLEGWDHRSEPALYLMGYFEVLDAGKPDHFGDKETHRLFANNFHVRHRQVFEQQKAKLVLVKGSERSRMLKEAVCISVMGRNRVGQPLKVLSPEMQEIFGTFKGRLSFQRSPTRWVDPAYVTTAAEFMRSLR
jgi:hypothetical protein